MEFVWALALLTTAICVSSASALPASVRTRPASSSSSSTKYTTRYDYIDVDSILRSRRLLKNYMECVLERGPCTREGLELRKNIPDALETECAKCSEKQKENAGKIMGYLLQFEKEYWKKLLEKYDANGTFRKKYDVGDFGFGDEEYDEGEEENVDNN